MIVQKAKRVENFLFELVAVCMSMIFVFANYPSSRVHFDLTVRGVTAEAMVVGEERTGSGKQRKVFPFFEFYLADNTKVVAKSYTGLALKEDRKLKPVEIVYDPDQPQIALPWKHLLFWKLIWVWVLLAISISLLFYGIFLLRKAFSTQRG